MERQELKTELKHELKQELSPERIKQLSKMPLIESRVFKSKDGQYIVHKTVVTDIKPINYLTAVLKSSGKEEKDEE